VQAKSGASPALFVGLVDPGETKKKIVETIWISSLILSCNEPNHQPFSWLAPSLGKVIAFVSQMK
jgi:hypothetical protein